MGPARQNISQAKEDEWMCSSFNVSESSMGRKKASLREREREDDEFKSKELLKILHPRLSQSNGKVHAHKFDEEIPHFKWLSPYVQ